MRECFAAMQPPSTLPKSLCRVTASSDPPLEATHLLQAMLPPLLRAHPSAQSVVGPPGTLALAAVRRRSCSDRLEASRSEKGALIRLRGVTPPSHGGVEGYGMYTFGGILQIRSIYTLLKFPFRIWGCVTATLKAPHLAHAPGQGRLRSGVPVCDWADKQRS